MAVILLLQQIVTLSALGIAWGIWYTVGRSEKGAQLASNVG